MWKVPERHVSDHVAVPGKPMPVAVTQPAGGTPLVAAVDLTRRTWPWRRMSGAVAWLDLWDRDAFTAGRTADAVEHRRVVPSEQAADLGEGQVGVLP